MIDWFTVIAQIVNFLILIALLKYFLYGRILAAMEKRQQEIAARWDEAQQQRAQAEQELQAASDKNRQLDQQRENMLTAVRDEVELYRQQLTSKVRDEVDELQQRWADAIGEETDSFLHDLQRRASEEVCAIARRVLADLANARLERQIVEHFLVKLEQMNHEQRQSLTTSLARGQQTIIVQSTCELTDDLRKTIVDSLRRQFSSDLDVQFEPSRDLLCGIALLTNAHTLAWDIRDYLVALEQQLRQTLDEEAASRKSRPLQAADEKR